MTNKVQPTATWSQYTIDEPRKRRAELVCVVCHGKKTKCDLQDRLNRKYDSCTYCANNNRICQTREGKRRKRKTQDSDAPPVQQESHLATPPTTDTLTSFSGQENDQRLVENVPVANVDNFTGHHEGGFGKPNGRQEAALATRPKEFAESHEGDLDTGFMKPFTQEQRIDARAQSLSAKSKRQKDDAKHAVSLDLLHIFIETYYDSCYSWCPILDRTNLLEELRSSPLLSNALATLGSNLQPPILPDEGPASYYNRARRMFYEDEEPNILTCLRAVLLFNWYAPRATSLVHRHSSWWWTSVVIRHAQQMNLHRSQPPDTPRALLGLQRRVWWTAFARERLTALCQSKPPIINPEDCTVPEPSLEDFPPDMQHDVKPQLFIYWVRLCSICGSIAQHLSYPRSSASTLMSSSNQTSLRRPAHDMVMWIQNLPPNLSLHISEEYTSSYSKDVHQLHLPYLSAVMTLNLRKAPEDGGIPQAEPPAIFAASCMARIFKDILARGDVSFLMPITSWHCGVSFLALLSAYKDPTLRRAALADMEIIRLMCDQIRRKWGSSNVVYQGMERLRAAVDQEVGHGSTPSLMDHVSPSTTFGTQSLNGTSIDNMGVGDEMPDWLDYFPFASAKTSEMARLQMESKAQTDHPYIDPTLLSNYLSSDLHDFFFEGFDAEFGTLGNEGF